MLGHPSRAVDGLANTLSHAPACSWSGREWAIAASLTILIDQTAARQYPDRSSIVTASSNRHLM